MLLSTFDLSWYSQWPLRRSPHEEFSRPGLTNFLGSAQVAADPSSFRHVMFPPVSGAEESTAYLTLNNIFLPATRTPVDIHWCPWRVDRSCEVAGWQIRSRLCMASGEQGLLLELSIENTAATPRDLEAALRLSGRCVNRGPDPWFWGVPKVAVTLDALLDHGGLHPIVQPIGTRGRLTRERPFEGNAHAGQACTAQVLSPAPDHWARNGDAAYTRTLAPGERFTLYLAFAMETDETAIATADRLLESPQAIFDGIEAAWKTLWKSAFTPAGPLSGQLADLDLDPDIAPVAVSAILNALQSRRTFRILDGATRYNISTPRRVEACFYPNDWALAGELLAQLDPQTTWTQLESALAADIRRCNQINLLTNQGGDFTGNPWPYTIDIYNCFSVAWHLLQAECGENHAAWHEQLHTRKLPTPSGEQTLLDVFENLAFDWRSRKVAPVGLADYGPKEELLECVSSYEHIVAGLNAGAAWMLFRLADIYRMLERAADADHAQAEAQSIVDAILQHLYVEGCGWFRCLDATGANPVECRHCWDFGMLGSCIGDRLPQALRNQMVAFFQRELQTPGWMRGLSPQDADAAVSGQRVDHQFNGSFSAWPAQAMLALQQLGRPDLVRDWLPGLARTARQGPFAQAHFDEAIVPDTHGGATKATDEAPHCCHWSNLGGGLFWAALHRAATQKSPHTSALPAGQT